MLRIEMHTESCTDRLQTEAVVSFIVYEGLLDGVEGRVFEYEVSNYFECSLLPQAKYTSGTGKL